VGVGFPGGTAWDVEYELRDIRAFYKDTRLYFNQQATMNTVQNEHCDVLHLTVECEYTHRAPGNAYLVFSDGESPTGSRDVPFGQLFSLPPFPAIVLSNIAADVDGVDPALPWIFLANGSSAVITNALVPSRQTKWFLCEAFYTALLAGKSPQEAFRQVQLSMVKDPEFAAPFVWGPFFLWGK
jgi:CHAT domain-containing protein